jgi:hypothetical protein
VLVLLHVVGCRIGDGVIIVAVNIIRARNRMGVAA